LGSHAFKNVSKVLRKKGLKTIVLDESFGEEWGERIGIKSAMIEIKGKYAYGFLKEKAACIG